MGKPSAFSIILLFCGTLIALTFAANFYLIINELPQFDPAMWAVLGGSIIGEVVTFSVYRIAKEKDRKKAQDESAPASIKARHAIIQDMEEEDEQQH